MPSPVQPEEGTNGGKHMASQAGYGGGVLETFDKMKVRIEKYLCIIYIFQIYYAIILLRKWWEEGHMEDGMKMECQTSMCKTLDILGKICHTCGQKTGFKQHEGAGQSPSPFLVVFSFIFLSLGVAPPFSTR